MKTYSVVFSIIGTCLLANAALAQPMPTAAKPIPPNAPAISQTTEAFTKSADPVLQALRDELSRSRSLRAGLDVPYFIEYALDDGETYSVSATLGSVLGSRRRRFRLPRIQVRIGDYKFDNTNFIGTGAFSGTRYDVAQFPIDDSYSALRHHLWLATDMVYRSALDSLARKRATLRSTTATDLLPDFHAAEPLILLREPSPLILEESAWSVLVRKISAVFENYPEVFNSLVDFNAIRNIQYLLTTEGTQIREPAITSLLRIRGTSQAKDGMILRDSAAFHSWDPKKMPPEAEIEAEARRIAENLTALARAPLGEAYTGPIVFEGEAAAQMFAEVLGRNLALTRRPVMPAGRPVAFRTSELEGRLESRVLPEWMDVVDDPTQTEWRGRPLFGHYRVDLEGVAPQPLTLIEKGILKKFLLTRQPVKGSVESNGRARLPGSFGAKAAMFGNLFVRASETVPKAELKKKLIDLCRDRAKPYGLIVRKMDFPSTASLNEIRLLLMRSSQSGGGSYPVSSPVLVYRVYLDGREELVRGLRFRGLNTRSLRDILAASEEVTVFDYLDNGAVFALTGAGTYAAESSVIAPSILMDEVEVEVMQEELTRPPIVPPPPLGGSAASDASQPTPVRASL